MNNYRVYGGVATIGAEQTLHLTGAQIRARAYALRLPKDYKLTAGSPKEKPPLPADADVVSAMPLQFKSGEVIGLPDVPNHLVSLLEPLDGARTKNEIKAAEKVALVKAESPKPAPAKPAAGKTRA